jgi:hypothetical protein
MPLAISDEKRYHKSHNSVEAPYAIGRRLAVSIIVIILHKKLGSKLPVIWLYGVF